MATAIKLVPDTTEAQIEFMHWLANHPEIFDGCEEGWVAVADRRIVAHGPEFEVVAREAENQGFPDHVMIPIMPEEWIG